MSKELALSDGESSSFNQIIEKVRVWSEQNQWAIGLGEMAAGAGLIAYAVHNGILEMGTQLVATELGGGFSPESLEGAAGGSGLGALAGTIVGSIGVAGMGGAIGIPAALVIGGTAAVLGMAGYTVGDVAHNLNTAAFDFGDVAINGSYLLVGLALIIDGGRRLINDSKTLSAISSIRDNVLIIQDLTSKIVAKTKEELMGFIDELKSLPEDKVQATLGSGSAAVGAGLGASAGGAIAAGSVSVLGSSTLGSAALSLGLVSAPILPVILGIAGGAGLGYAAYKAVKYWSGDSAEKNEPDTDV